MKQQTLLSRLLLPVLVVLLLLPPSAVSSFQQAAARYAYGEASGDLEDLQQNILPLMENAFEHQASTPGGGFGTGGDLSPAGQAPWPTAWVGGPTDDIGAGLSRWSIPGRGGGEAAAPLAEAWSQSIQSGELSLGTASGVDGWLWRNLVGTGP